MTRGLLVSLCALVVLVGGCGSSQSPAGGSVHPSRSDLESIFEDEPLLHSDPAKAFDVMRSLGVDRVRVYVPWDEIAPDPHSTTAPQFDASDPGAYPPATLALFDTVVRLAAQRHVGLDFTVGGPAPDWATGRGAPTDAPAGSWRPSAHDFGLFVHALATRYDGTYKPDGAPSPLPRVDFWSIWNEPNYGPDLSPQAPAPTEAEIAPTLYRHLLNAAWSALQQTGHADDTILIGELAPRGQTSGGLPGNFGGMVPLRFVRALYCLDGSLHPLRAAAASARGCPATTAESARFVAENPALFHASGFSDHPYPQGGMPPNQRTPDEPDYADLASLSNLESMLDRAQGAYGSSLRLPIYSTEFGYQTNPPETIAHTTSPTTAALYLNWAEYISWRDLRVRSYDQYLLTDPPRANALGGFATGLLFKNGVRKATYDAYRMPLYLPAASESKGDSIEVWGCVRPAPYARASTGRQQLVKVQLRAGSSGKFRTVRAVPITNPHGYFDTDVSFRATGGVRLEWSYPHGLTIHSRTAQITVH